MIDCRNSSGNVVERLGNIVLRVIVPLRRNKGAYSADWPTDTVFTRHRFVSATSQNLFDTPRK